MNIYRLGNIEDKKDALKKLGVQSSGITIMAKKMELFYFYIKDLKTPAVNILKQDALSIGAELAVPSGVVLCKKPTYDCILIATKKHIEILSQKELAQPFGLREVAKNLKEFIDIKLYSTKIMGIINANDDSFFAESRFKASDAIFKIKKMIEDGANIIDIGAVSSRPNASLVSPAEELKRIKPICDRIKELKLYEQVIFSIDSYTPIVIEYALQSGFSIINDINGAVDDNVIKLAVKYNSRLSIMHKKGTPQDMQNNPQYDDIIVEVSDFFQTQINKCEKFGIKKENIILDVGIGFGKTLEHNITLIKNLSHFRHFGCELLIGASRKSIIDKISESSIEDRLAGTLAIHIKSIENGANIIRCHDVHEHKQAISILEFLK